MLTYAFDLLYQIYEEEGYDPLQIPRLILEKNLYGVEIDHRAGDLAAFALTMKARQKDRRFFRRGVMPNICVLENVHFTADEIESYMDAVGSDLFTKDLQFTLTQFEQANNFGSLIRPLVTEIGNIQQRLVAEGIFENLFLHATNQKVQQILEQAQYLNPRYHVVVANPPYMGGRGMNIELRDFAKVHYPDSRSDLFAMFVERNMDLAKKGGFIGLMTPVTWMFLSSYEKLRSRVLNEHTLTSLVRPEYHAFYHSAHVPICGFSLFTQPVKDFKGTFIDLSDFYGADQQPKKAVEAIRNPGCGWFYRSSSTGFKKIPGSPIAYWVSDAIISLYEHPLIGASFVGKEGVGTRNDEAFIRYFWEVSISKIGKEKRWIATDKAGGYRRWYMGFSYLMDWENNGYRIRNFRNPDGSLRSRPQNLSYLFKSGVSWGKVGSGIASFRWRPSGFGFNDAAPAIFGKNVFDLLPQLNSKVTRYLLTIRGGTLNVTTGVIEETALFCTLH